MPKAPPYIYEKLTWLEADRAARAGKVPILPVGSIEQHGPHLPLDTDCVLPRAVAIHAAERLPDEILVLPTVAYGYTGHVMDFPGTLNVHHTHFIDMVADVARSLAYHGFKKMILLNGHGSNMPNLDLAARRVNLETDAECVLCSWWSLLTVDKDFLPKWRESAFPGGCSHACELETSAYLHADPDNVRKDLCADGSVAYHSYESAFQYVDIFGAGCMALTSWTSSYTESGTCGAASLASEEKGRAVIEEAARQLARFVQEFIGRPRLERRDRHSAPPTFKMPWNQEESR